jgi:hypothetical protein
MAYSMYVTYRYKAFLVSHYKDSKYVALLDMKYDNHLNCL